MSKRSRQSFLLSTFYFLLSHKKGFTPLEAARACPIPVRYGTGSAPLLLTGFTIIEVLVAVSITIFLSSALILYNSQSRSQVALYVEQGKIAQTILRAKSLAISTYVKENNCGYGVHFDYGQSPAKYNIFSYGGPGVSCSSISTDGIDINNESPVNNFPAFEINPILAFGQGANRLTDVLFIPPDPETVMMAEGDFVPVPNGVVYIQTKDGLAQTQVKVGAAGQITF